MENNLHWVEDEQVEAWLLAESSVLTGYKILKNENLNYVIMRHNIVKGTLSHENQLDVVQATAVHLFAFDQERLMPFQDYPRVLCDQKKNDESKYESSMWFDSCPKCNEDARVLKIEEGTCIYICTKCNHTFKRPEE